MKHWSSRTFDWVRAFPLVQHRAKTFYVVTSNCWWRIRKKIYNTCSSNDWRITQRQFTVCTAMCWLFVLQNHATAERPSLGGRLVGRICGISRHNTDLCTGLLWLPAGSFHRFVIYEFSATGRLYRAKRSAVLSRESRLSVHLSVCLSVCGQLWCWISRKLSHLGFLSNTKVSTARRLVTPSMSSRDSDVKLVTSQSSKSSHSETSTRINYPCGLFKHTLS